MSGMKKSWICERVEVGDHPATSWDFASDFTWVGTVAGRKSWPESGSAAFRMDAHANGKGVTERILYDWLSVMADCTGFSSHKTQYKMDVWEPEHEISQKLHIYSILMFNLKFLQKSTISVGWL